LELHKKIPVLGKLKVLGMKVVSWFSPAPQQRTTRSLCRPSPHWDGEENGKKKVKLMGRDKDSLTQQQSK